MARDLSKLTIQQGNYSTESDTQTSRRQSQAFNRQEEEDDDLPEDDESEDGGDHPGQDQRSRGKQEIQIVEIEEPNQPAKWNGDPANGVKNDGDSDFKGKFKKRINHLTATAAQLAKERDEERKNRVEAAAFARALQEENAELKRLTLQGGKGTIQSQIEAGEALEALAVHEYQLAVAAADPIKMGEAQKKLTSAQVRLEALRPRVNEFEEAGKELEQNITDSKAKAAKADADRIAIQRQQPQQAQVPAEREKWFNDNPWFDKSFAGKPPEKIDAKTRHAIYLDGEARAQGFKPDSPEYFEAINEGMAERFPEEFGDNMQSNVTVNARRQPSNQRAKIIQGNKVFLSKRQLEMAKSLGLRTPEQLKRYALELAKVND